MFANERCKIICDKIKAEGRVTTSELCDLFKVSIETVRKDLLLLEQKNQLQRVHGGAVSTKTAKYTSLSERKITDVKEKAELSELAVSFVNEGDVILVGAGSTAIHFARALKKFENLTIVTYCLDVLEELKGHKSFNLILCGGRLDENENAFCGALAELMMDYVSCDKAFIFPSAISLKSGISDFKTDFIRIQQAAIKKTEKVFILAENDKYEKRAPFKSVDISPEYTFVSDSKLPGEIKGLYLENDIRIVTNKGDLKK